VTAGATTPANPPRILRRDRLKLRFRRLRHLLVWLGVLVVTVALYLRQERGFVVQGFAAETRYSVASETTGRLQRFVVALNEEVHQGQIVASIADDELLLQLQEARTELQRLTHELGRERALWDLDAAGQQVDQQTNLRRFARDASNTRIEYLAAHAELAADRIELQGLELILSRTRQLERSELTAVAALDADRIAFEALGAKVARQDSTVAALLAGATAAETRHREFLDTFVADVPDAELLLKPLESAIEVQGIRIELVNLAISKRVLRAPAAGRVVEVFRRAGEMVAAGQPVLSILEPRATELVAYVPEQRVRDLEPGAEVRIRSVSDPGRTFVSSISCVGSRVQQLPLRADPAAMTPHWGLAVFIPLPDAVAAKPGTAFEVSFR